MKNSSMKKYRDEVKVYSDLYKQGILSEEDLSFLFSQTVSNLMERQLNRQLYNLTAMVYKSYAKGLN